MNTKTKLVEKKYLVPFILITALFALWGFANDITNPMVAAFQTVMELSAAKASLVQFAFYGGYATMAIPAALFIRRYSYKSAILLGLGLYAVGAFLFIPAAAYQQFSFFCISLYILTFGLAFLETTANPYILSLGSKETSTRRHGAHQRHVLYHRERYPGQSDVGAVLRQKDHGRQLHAVYEPQPS